MLHTLLFTLAAVNQFTGYEHTRIETMLGILVTLSITVWVLAGLCIVTCKGLLMLLAFIHRSHRVVRKNRGSRHAY